MKFGNKIIAAILTGCILLSGSGMKAMATDETGQEANSSGEASSSENEGEDSSGGYKIDSESIASTKMPQTEEELEKQMAAQRAILPETNSISDWPQGPEVTADAAVLMDVESGAILYGKQMDKKEYPASITKIMTAVLALENGDIENDKVLFSQESIDFLEPGDAHIGMTPGEEISLKDAMYGMLLASANEASYAIAENIGNKLGIGYDGFLELMTTRAKELGCENSHFENVNGLHDENHYVSARDMAIMGAAAYQYDVFREIIRTPQHTIPVTNLMPEERTFQQNHKMIYERNQYYYEGCTGGKTGYTDQARTTLISFAEKNGMKLVCVVLRTRGEQAYTDTAALFDYGFDNFQKLSLKMQETSEDFAEIPEDAYVVLPKDVSFEDVEKKVTQEEKGKEAAAVEYFYKDALVGKADVSLSEAYLMRQKEADDKEAQAAAAKEKKSGMPLWVKIVIGILGAAVALMAALYVYLLKEKERRRRERLRRKREQKRRARRERERREREEEERYANMHRYPGQYGGWYPNKYSSRYQGSSQNRPVSGYPSNRYNFEDAKRQQQYRTSHGRNDRVNPNKNTRNRKW